ncbi:HK97-gp10 family putative phage morphogenesis protein [Clostridium paraputrificum]|uniref:HK97-gp10 family putative phage morphogenesis protein n=1 Tax=Clostridium paraputrificum TaxID=29363 RepID=UPI00189AB161|nr:HK97-gp10 family putative phage morphogenesis protein [Clostridium paraputrificum]MDB2122386.1 HK97 gp10 family phage protein [Clostridium paraputrificum]
MWIEFEGLDELIKKFESVSSEKEIDKANIKIIKECAKIVEKNLKPKVHRSKDPKKSGIKGLKTGEHAADNIEVSKIKNIKGVKFITVGWDQSKNSPYSYMQWEEWGNTTREPHAVLYPTIEASQKEMNRVVEEEYKNLISNLK